jgi:hypothetical protein
LIIDIILVKQRTVIILTKLGYKVEETPQKQCCGAVDQHLSANDEALQKIKKNIDAWFWLGKGNKCGCLFISISQRLYVSFYHHGTSGLIMTLLVENTYFWHKIWQN